MKSSDPRERVEQLGHSFERVVLTLNRNQQRLGGSEGVERQQAKRWRAIDDDVVVICLDTREGVLQPEFSLLNFDQFDFGARQIFICRDDIETGSISAK